MSPPLFSELGQLSGPDENFLEKILKGKRFFGTNVKILKAFGAEGAENFGILRFTRGKTEGSGIHHLRSK